MKKFIILGVIILFIVAGGFWYYYSGRKVFKSNECGFEVSIPKAWKQTEHSGCSFEFSKINEVKNGFATFGKIIITHDKRNNNNDKFFNDYVTNMKNTYNPGIITEIKSDGQSGFKSFQSKSIGSDAKSTTTTECLKASDDGRIYTIIAQSQDANDGVYENQIEKILSSFRIK